MRKRHLKIEDVIEPHPSNRKRAPIAVSHPHLALEWYYKKNCGFGPEDFSYGSTVKPWWRCQKNAKHIWQAAIQNRTNLGLGCPFCSGRRVSPDNCLARCHPKIAREWHPTKNQELTAKDITAYSKRMVWWLCRTCQFEWKTNVHCRTRNGNGCPRCARSNYINLFADEYAYALKFFNKKLNKDIDPSWLKLRTEVHWTCLEGKDHHWIQTFPTRCSKETFCPFCDNRKPSANNCLAKKSRRLSQEWHEKRNGKLKPYMVTANAKIKVWWSCMQCGHAWKAAVSNRFRNGTGCPKCWKARSPEVAAQVGKKLRISDALVNKIKSLYAKGTSQIEIARILKLGKNTIPRVLQREGILPHRKA